MHNNKSRMKERDKSNAELRRMQPKDNAGAGMINGRRTGTHDGGHEKSGRKD